MRSKNVINNKNIIQICYEKVKRKKRRQQSNQYNENSNLSKSINIQPKFINSFPNSSRLEPDDRKVRFLQSMRDPFSTKSPYSIYDNGSNTFQREGNTSGVEEEVLPQLRQDDYFQEPRSFGGVPQSRPQSRPQYKAPERLRVASPLSPITQMDEYDDDAGRSWYSPNLNDGEEVDEEEEEYQMNQEVPQTRFLSNKPFSAPIPTFSSPYRSPEIQDEPITIDSPIPASKEKTYEQESTRFGSNKPFSPPMFSTPYRSQQIQDDPIILDTPITENQEKEFQQLNEEIKQFQAKEPTEIDENERRRQEQKQANQALSNELERKRKIRKKYTTVRDKLQALLASGETKVDKESKLKLDIINLLKDPQFKEYTGDKNIRNTSGAQKILDFINAGSIGLLEQIKQLEADKIESPLKKRDPPRSQANIQTLRSAGGAISGSGISQYSKLPIAKR